MKRQQRPCLHFIRGNHLSSGISACPLPFLLSIPSCCILRKGQPNCPAAGWGWFAPGPVQGLPYQDLDTDYPPWTRHLEVCRTEWRSLPLWQSPCFEQLHFFASITCCASLVGSFSDAFSSSFLQELLWRI